MPRVSIVMPSMNEESTIRTCILKAQSFFKNYGLEGEIIVVDNSTDRTAEIASSMGAVVIPSVKGYGNAYLKGLAKATGDYIAIADADNTYDLNELPMFFEILMGDEADFVIGSRLRGDIKKGAMPWLHQYIGNPILTWLLNVLFGTSISDAHCGMRAFTREALEKMNLKSHGMELASEMVIEAADKGLRIKEVPISYDLRDSPSKLRSLHDGWRHIRFMMLYRPVSFLLIPGTFVFLVGAALLFTLPRMGNVAETRLHSFILASMLTVIGSQLFATGLYLGAYGYINGLYVKESFFIKKIMDYHSLEEELFAGMVFLLAAIIIGLKVVLTWVSAGYGSLFQIQTALFAMVFGSIGLQMIFTAIFLSVLMLGMDTDR
ncbi:glycosyltransferase family 2 protein [uncultured Methanomethylovorans sp.]|uniref:glycosyltransferase family 2 protein n=1 Tax=uncultured Methanomethylovorans sp. TaxID=183759 RepID=UPI002AA68D19|nr:glycosyltransferase family 2 protein [uncultured Methanomethylovorans sp.]